ncbi:hypothetical protein ACFWIQ_19525 [Kitasatospora sp. NPDC127059]|uniref:hypothetical protein n=1 Tax=unclassified Kitasatospora TaxID=2633591 RepID=UPI00366588B7
MPNSDDPARITVNPGGLLNGVPHVTHIHIKGSGECPAADAATFHHGDRAVSTADGLPAHGPIGTSLTTGGDTGPALCGPPDRPSEPVPVRTGGARAPARGAAGPYGGTARPPAPPGRGS